MNFRRVSPERVRRRTSWLAPLLLTALLIGCRGTGDPQMPSAVLAGALPEPTLPATPDRAMPAAPALAQVTRPAAAATMGPQASPTTQPSATPQPSDTPPPVVSLSVPPSWTARARSAVDRANAVLPGYTWRLAENGAADINLVRNEPGLAVVESAVVLAVPFTETRETVTLSEAEQMLQDDQGAVQIVPWAELPRGHKALRIDGLGPADSGYPFQETWVLASEPSFAGAAALLAPLLREEETNVVHLAAVGDIMLDRSLGWALARGDLLYPFSDVLERMQQADVTVGNLESALGDVGEPQPKRYPFRAPPQAAEALALAGFDVVSLANNHGMDYGPQALEQALALLREQGVLTVGAGSDRQAAQAPKIVVANGLATAFLGYVDVPVEASTGFDIASWQAGDARPGIAWADPAQIKTDIAAIRDQVDLVVVLLHSGHEYVPAPSDAQRTAAQAAIDAGADLVIGHHAHILQGVAFRDRGVIIYGTGNFAFDIDGPPETAIFHIWLDKSGVREVVVEPALVQFGGQPRLATPWEAPAIRDRVYYLSSLLALE